MRNALGVFVQPQHENIVGANVRDREQKGSGTAGARGRCPPSRFLMPRKVISLPGMPGVITQ
jgi:hypothetical protein